MKSKMNIKSILFLAVISILSLMFLNMSLAANMATVSVETANLRESASSDSEIVGQMSQNEEVEILENSGEWCKVKYDGTEGYVKTSLLNMKNSEENTNTATEENTVNEVSNETTNEVANQTTTQETKPEETEDTDNGLGNYFVTEDIKIKLVPLINATDMVEVKKDQIVKAERIINGWANVESEDGKTRGWIRVEKLKTEAQKRADDEAKAAQEAAEAEAAAKEAELNAPAIKTSYVQIESVNLRKETNTTSEILGRLPKNTEVEVISEEDGWSKCRTAGLIGFVSTQYLSDKKVEEPTSRASTEIRTPASGNASSVISFAQSLIGSKYVSGKKGPNTFDCSGFVYYVYKQFGISLGGSTYSQINDGVSVDKANVQPGDLVFFNNNGHVGIYIGNDQFVHAANPAKGVRTDTFSTYGTFYAARRVM